jgi:MFS superfamily sulfate permease-like transporter
LSKKGRDQFLTFMITFLSIVFTDLLVGIGIGLAVGFFMILWKNFSTPFSFSEIIGEGKPIEIVLSENVTFLNKASILQALNAIPSNSDVLIDATMTHYIHPDVIEIIEDFMIKANKHNIKVKIEGDFREVNKNHLAFFLKKVSKDGDYKTPYFETIFKN